MHISDAVVRYSPEGAVVFANPPGRALMGISESGELHTCADSGFGLEKFVRALVKDEATGAKGAATHEIELTASGPPLRVTLFPERDDAGKVTSVLALMHGAAAPIPKRPCQPDDCIKKNRLAALIRKLPIGICIGDATGEVRFVNEAAVKLYGFASEHEALRALADSGNEHETLELCHLDGSLAHRGAWPQSKALRGEIVRDYEIVVKNRGRGSERVVSFSAAAHCDGAGGPELFICAMHDVNERRIAEQILIAANDQLIEGDRMRNEFLALLSHELRNPLSPICSSLYLLEIAEPDSAQAKRAHDVISRQVAQLSRLVDDLLDIARISCKRTQLHRGPIDINDLVLRAIEDQRILFESAGLCLEPRPHGRPVFVDGDPVRLAQVLSNLLQNAVKFTPRGGRVCVTLAVQEAERRVAIEVADNGIGIEPATIKDLFEPFVQANPTIDRRVGGLGIGLALVKSIVELHGGDVAARSFGLGKGAVFTVLLPLARLPAGPERDASSLEAQYSGGHGTGAQRRRILIVEDNVDAADSLGEILTLRGHEVAVAYSGIEGLAKARAVKPDLVLCDIGLPGMDGYALARAIRADPEIGSARLVAISGYAFDADIQRSADAGFERHIAKPPAIDELERLALRLD